ERYRAAIPVSNPTQPPAVCHPKPIPMSPPASKKKVIESRRNMVQSTKLVRKVAIHIRNVNTPHIKRARPTALAAGGLIHPAPAVHSSKAYQHQKAPYEAKAIVPKVLPF